MSQFLFLYFPSYFIRKIEIGGKVEVMIKQHRNGYLLSNSVVESKHSHLASIPVIILVHSIPLQTEFSVNIGKFDNFLPFFFFFFFPEDRSLRLPTNNTTGRQLQERLECNFKLSYVPKELHNFLSYVFL